jgi:hypothetical protein
MNMDEFSNILNWIGTDFTKLDVVEQIFIVGKLTKVIDDIKPIYEKYQSKKTTNDLDEFLNSLLKNNNDT